MFIYLYRGAKVKVIYGRCEVEIPDIFVQKIKTYYYDEFQKALEKNLKWADMIFQVAAVPDFQVQKKMAKKMIEEFSTRGLTQGCSILLRKSLKLN